MSEPITVDWARKCLRTFLCEAIFPVRPHTAFLVRPAAKQIRARNPASMYCSRKPEIPATTTARCFRFLEFGSNGDLRHAPFFTVIANRALNLLSRDHSYIFRRLGGRFQELLLPPWTLRPSRHIPVKFRPAHALFNLLAKRSKRNSQFDRLLRGREAARKDHVLQVLSTEAPSRRRERRQ